MFRSDFKFQIYVAHNEIFFHLCSELVTCRSSDLVTLSHAAEEGIRIMAEGKFLASDSFPGNGRNKYCLASKVHSFLGFSACIMFLHRFS